MNRAHLARLLSWLAAIGVLTGSPLGGQPAARNYPMAKSGGSYMYNWPDWRSQKEKDHVFAQFEEARAVYRRFLSEAPPSTQ